MLKNIVIDGLVSYSYTYEEGQEDLAEAWYNKQIAKPGFIPDEHTVEDVPDPEPTEDEQALAELRTTDARMARIGEDLTDLLIAKGIIAVEELPEEAQAVITKRKNARGKLK